MPKDFLKKLSARMEGALVRKISRMYSVIRCNSLSLSVNRLLARIAPELVLTILSFCAFNYVSLFPPSKIIVLNLETESVA